MVGQTTFNSISKATTQAGVFGQDLAPLSKNNAGVKGTSVNGDGVDGLAGHSSSGFIPTNAAGVAGDSQNGDGVRGSSTSKSGAFGVSTNGIGIFGVSTNFVGVNAVGGFFNSITGLESPALSVVGDSAGGGFNNDLIDACPPSAVDPCDVSHAVFSVDGAGNITTVASIFSGKDVAVPEITVGAAGVPGAGSIDITGQARVRC